MKGTKAEALDRWAQRQGRAMHPLRLFRPWRIRRQFRRRHHRPLAGGEPGGLRRLLPRAAGRDRLVHGRLAGAAAGPRAGAARPTGRRRRGSLAGLVLIAPAVDFTEELMWKRFPPEVKREIEEKGVWARPSQYSRGALSDHPPADRGGPQPSPARRHDRDRLSGAHPAGRAGPGRAVAARASSSPSRFARDDVVLTLVKDGDHRLSRPEDIERLLAAVAEF